MAPPREPISSEPSNERLSQRVIWAFSSPRIAFGIMFMLFSTYLMKFATDELLIAPAVMGGLIAASRLWDAVSDPVVGYLSDRTVSRHGRRRSWMFYSILPMAFGLVMIWSPPPGLAGLALAIWMGVALILYETAGTAFVVPHGALGVELTSDYHERTRLYGWLHMIGAIGSILGLAVLQVMNMAEDKRSFAFLISMFGAINVIGICYWSTLKMPERKTSQGRGGKNIFKSFGDAFRNQHARLLLVFFAIESFGAASVGMLAPYLVEYVIPLQSLLVLLLVVYSVPQFVLTPLWMYLGRRVGKKRLWMSAMWVQAITFLGFFFVLVPGEPSALVWVFAFVLGVAAGVGGVMAPAIQADVIDFDEYLTDERKEGSYLALWNLVRKSAGSVAALATGFALQVTGFEPNVEQTETTQFAMRALIALLPAGCYLIGALLFLRFAFNETEHRKVRAELDARLANRA